MSAPRKHIITGGPGSGKTTLVEALVAHGHGHSPEVSRRLIREQSARDDGVLPWDSLEAFAALAVEEMLREHDKADERDGLVFFDRGLPDVFGYLDDSAIEIPGAWLAAHERCTYASTVFVLPPWPEIYVNDEERPQTLAQSRSLYRALVEAYGRLGYTLIEVPRVGIRERADFVLAQL